MKPANCTECGSELHSECSVCTVDTCCACKLATGEDTESERVLRRRRRFMPDYDKRLEEWLS